MAMKLAELRKQGYQALVDSLGVVGMLRFLQQLEVGYGDYTAERHQWLDELTLADFQSYVQEKKSITPNAELQTDILQTGKGERDEIKRHRGRNANS
jgi:hypothetical protein